jgi:hypothetical protein
LLERERELVCDIPQGVRNGLTMGSGGNISSLTDQAGFLRSRRAYGL